jgi:hypothetical protein
MSPPSSRSKNKPSQETGVKTGGQLSETSVVFQRTTRRYIPEDNTLQVTLGFPTKPLYALLSHACYMYCLNLYLSRNINRTMKLR